MNRVLVVGDASSNKDHLIADVIGQLVDSSNGPTAWTVDNRYFTAPLEFHFCDPASEPPQDGPWHGLILVFDPTSKHAAAARPHYWEDRWAGVAEDAGVRVLVSHPASGDDMMPDERFDAWSDWCVDHAIEFLETDMESSVGGRDNNVKRLLDDYGGDEERGGGKQRLLEALSQNMWPIMQKKDKVAAVEVEEAPKKRAGEAADMIDADLMEMMGDPDGPDAFEKAITAAREMREHALTLPDDERREFASKMALQLMSLMSDFGDDDDEDEDESENSAAGTI